MGRQLMLWEAEVTSTGPGEARVSARRPVMEGGVDEVRVILGGKGVVSRRMVHLLRQEGKLRAWQPRGGRPRKDGRASNAHWVFDLQSAYDLRAERMR